MSDYSPLHLYFLNKSLWAAWPRRWHLHDSSSEEQWGLLAENRTAICHCTLIKFIQGHCMGLKMDVKSIHQSQMDYVLYGFCPIAYSGRYRGLKGHGVCVHVSEYIHTHTLVCVSSQWVMMTTGSPYWSREPEEGCEIDSHTATRAAQASLHGVKHGRGEKVHVELGAAREGYNLSVVIIFDIFKWLKAARKKGGMQQQDA